VLRCFGTSAGAAPFLQAFCHWSFIWQPQAGKKLTTCQEIGRKLAKCPNEQLNYWTSFARNYEEVVFYGLTRPMSLLGNPTFSFWMFWNGDNSQFNGNSQAIMDKSTTNNVENYRIAVEESLATKPNSISV
jgi:hypothetical protein